VELFVDAPPDVDPAPMVLAFAPLPCGPVVEPVPIGLAALLPWPAPPPLPPPWQQ